MLAVPTTRAQRTWIAAVAASCLAACSTLPEPSLPAYRDHDVAAEYVVPANGRLPLPTSDSELLVQEFSLQPPPLAEHFRDTARWFTYAPGTRVSVRGRFRTYAAPGAHPKDAATVLVGAEHVRAIDAP